MATPSSKTAVANLALGHLKTDPVTSIDPPDEDSKAAQAMAKWYDQARRDTLEAHPWKFAQRRRALLADATAPAFEWASRFQAPNDYIRLAYIGEDWSNPDMDYDIEGDYILSNEASTLKLVYIWNIVDVTKFSPKFITAMSYKLAALAGYEITGNAQIVAAMEAQFQGSFSAAASISGQNRPTRRVERSRVKAARQNMAGSQDWRRWGDE